MDIHGYPWVRSIVIRYKKQSTKYLRGPYGANEAMKGAGGAPLRKNHVESEGRGGEGRDECNVRGNLATPTSGGDRNG